MQEPSHMRAVSLVLALSVVIAGWLLFEYGNRQLSEVPTPIPIADPAIPQTFGSASNLPATAPLESQNNLSATYKCEKSGRISYGDTPCDASQRVLAITANEVAPAATKNNLEEIRDRAAVWEKSRTEIEASSQVSNFAPVVVQTNEFRCQQIDRAIAAKDSELRQPHTAQWGDYLTGERKRLYDERFSLHC